MRLVFYIFILGLVIAFLHQNAVTLYWYWTLPWFDILMHFLGGLWVGMFALWFSNQLDREDIWYKILIVLLAVVMVGIMWEIFEAIVGTSLVQAGEYVSDTIIDLLMDIVGGLVSLVLFYRVLQNKNP